MSASIEASAVQTEPTWQFRVFYDGECPLCMREIELVRRLDDGEGRIDLIDLAAPDFDASDYGLDQSLIETRIHGQLPDGTIVEGVDVFVHLYETLDRGWLVRPARWPGVRRLLDWAYAWFARNRLRLTGRAPKTCPAPSEDQRSAASRDGIASKSG